MAPKSREFCRANEQLVALLYQNNNIAFRLKFVIRDSFSAIKMDKVKEGSNVLFTWKSPLNADDLKSVVDLAKQAAGSTGSVNVENLDRLDLTSLSKSSFDLVISCIVNPQPNVHNANIIGQYLNILKPGGSLVLYEEIKEIADGEKIKSSLIMNGYGSVVVTPPDSKHIVTITAEKPNFEVGSSCALKLGANVSEQVASLWKLDNTIDDDLIEADDLLSEEDLKKPDPGSLRVCGTTGMRKACKDCSCGLAEELAGEQAPAKTSSCGSVSYSQNVL